MCVVQAHLCVYVCMQGCVCGSGASVCGGHRGRAWSGVQQEQTGNILLGIPNRVGRSDSTNR